MKIRIDISGDSCFFLALLCMTLPLNWIIAMVFAGFFHELCHALTLMLLGGTIYRIRIGLTSTIMDISDLNTWKELICALAGPVGSLLLLSMVHYAPYTALCGLIHGLYNLLPLYPLDGGRMLYCILKMRYPEERTIHYCNCVNAIFSILLAGCGILVILCIKAGIMPFLLAVLLLSRSMHRKIPCKDCVPGVQ